jgi:hypothetical protein
LIAPNPALSSLNGCRSLLNPLRGSLTAKDPFHVFEMLRAVPFSPVHVPDDGVARNIEINNDIIAGAFGRQQDDFGADDITIR